jgi:hypothetical protein
VRIRNSPKHSSCFACPQCPRSPRPRRSSSPYRKRGCI